MGLRLSGFGVPSSSRACPKLERGIWHPYRRKWVTARKHLPVADVAAAGGWKSTLTLTKCYQQADQATMLSVVLGGAQLREKKAGTLVNP